MRGWPEGIREKGEPFGFAADAFEPFFVSLESPELKTESPSGNQIYQQLEQRLARRGYPRPSFRTPTRHVELLRGNASGLAEIAERVTTRYNEVRFGGRELESGELKQLAFLIREL